MNTSIQKLTKLILALVFTITFSGTFLSQSKAATITSAQSGPWNATSTWSNGKVPETVDIAKIDPSHTITIDAIGSCGTLEIAGSLIVNLPPTQSFTVTSVLTNTPIGSNPLGSITVISGNLRVATNFSLIGHIITIDGTTSSITFGGEKDFTRDTEYIRINDGGVLYLDNIGKGSSPKRQYNNGEITFPIGCFNGTSYSYTPVSINNKTSNSATTRSTFGASVTHGVISNGSPLTNVVNKTWQIFFVSGTADVSATFFWNPTDETNNLNQQNLIIFQNPVSTWIPLASPLSFNSINFNNSYPALFRTMRSYQLNGLIGSTEINSGIPNTGPVTYPKFAISQGPITPLPVELISFKAVKKNNDVVLTWETASEKNCKGFEVQTSTDGKNYEALNFVASQNGNTSVSQRYAYTDKAANNKEGLVYYRLKQIDLDGTIAYYSARVIDMGRFNYAASVYPNPFQDAFRVDLEATTAETVEVLVTDVTGKALYNTQHNLAKGANTLDIKLSNQKAGLYLLKVTTGNQTYTNRLVKQ